jgi:hypothetical protein
MRARVITAATLVALAGVGCGASVPAMSDDVPPGDDQPGDPDAPIEGFPDADLGPDAMLGPWSAPVMIPTGGTDGMAEDDGAPSLADTEMMFSGKLGANPKDIYVLTRQSPADPWGPAQLATGLNTTAQEQTPRFWDDGLTAYFSSARGGGVGGDDIWMATRAGPGMPWNQPTLVADVNSDEDERTLTPCAGNRYVVISFRNGTGDFFEGRLGGGAPTLVPQFSDPDAQETGSFVSTDCLRAWFASNRDGTIDIFYGHRDNVNDPWILDGKVIELSTDQYDESDPFVIYGGHRMVFTSTADGDENDLYESTR